MVRLTEGSTFNNLHQNHVYRWFSTSSSISTSLKKQSSWIAIWSGSEVLIAKHVVRNRFLEAKFSLKTTTNNLRIQ